MKTFAALKAEAEAATDDVALYRVVEAANAKLRRNIGKAQFLSCSPGLAFEADHYFQNVIPTWQRIVAEINAIWTAAVNGKPAQEIVAIIMASKAHPQG